MELTPLQPHLRHLSTGAAAGLVVAAGITTWRIIEEGSPGETAIAFAAAAVGMAVLLGLYYAHWVPKAIRKADPPPADAEILDRGKHRWWTLLAGVALALTAVGRAADDNVVVSGLLTGVVAGGTIAIATAASRLRRWQAEHGKELLQERRGFRTCHYVRSTDRVATGRFEREAQPSSAAASSSRP